MKKLEAIPLVFALMTMVCLVGCSKFSGSSSGFLEEISGVWRAKTDATMISIVYTDKKIRLLFGDNAIPVTLGEIDNDNKTVNLNLTLDGKPAVWTIRQVWDKENKSSHLVLTLQNGIQDELTFVRKISSDDLNRIANAEARSQGGAIGEAAKPAETVNAATPAPTTQQPQDTTEMTWSPSFDCSKVSNGPERLICSNKELSAADVQLAQTFKTALRASHDKSALKREQNSWLKDKRDVCSDAATMLQVYQERIAELSK